MEAIMEKFKVTAPYIAENLKSRITADLTEKEIMLIIHQEILSFFEKQKLMTYQYMAFNDDQRASFATVMYDLLEPMSAKIKPSLNPIYASYVNRSGKTGAKNFINNA